MIRTHFLVILESDILGNREGGWWMEGDPWHADIDCCTHHRTGCTKKRGFPPKISPTVMFYRAWPVIQM